MKMLKDLLDALGKKGGAKKLLKRLDKIKAANPNDPDLASLIDALKKMIDALQSGKPVDMNDFEKKAKDLFDRLKNKGKFRKIID